ncbi:MAG: AAC(3) family N-acetyltransferase [Planctomycetes bacterium]|nr:AAC(3) family N-acetyltransferase [Planctomycetota bacterium]
MHSPRTIRGKPQVAKEDIKKSLRTVGLAGGDVVFVHSSLSSFGHVKGGADAVIDALLEAVEPSGTVVVPTFTWGKFHDKQTAVFDLENTPSDVGRITEVFRKRPRAMRSRHICHSVAAIGPHGPQIMADGVSSLGPGSAFDQLHQLDSWYLLLGVDFGVCTALHMVEEYMEVPYRQYRDFKACTVILPDGRQVPCESTEYLRKPGYRNDFAKMGEVFWAEGILKTAQVGLAKITNARIRDIFAVTRKCLEKDIGFLLTEESRRLLHSR